MAIPTEADLNGPLADHLARYLQSAKHNARDRVRLFRLAWDVAGSSFGTRQLQYERFFFGDPVRVAGGLYMSYDKEPALQAVQRLLADDPSRKESF